MTLSIKHPLTAITPDNPAYEINPSNWNASHTMLVAANSIVGNNTGSTTNAAELSADQTRTLIDSQSSKKTTIHVESYGAVGDGTTDDSAAFASAITALSSAGGGVLLLGPRTYYVPSGVQMADGISIIGTGPRIKQDASWDFGASGDASGVGTVLKGNLTNPGIYFNATDATFSPTGTELETAKLNSVRIENVGFVNCTYGIKIGAWSNPGAFFSTFKNLHARQCSKWGFYFENFIVSDFEYMTCLNMNSGAIGGMFFGASVYPLVCGATRFGTLYVDHTFGSATMARGIVFRARQACGLNDITVSKIASIQSGMNGPSSAPQVSQNCTFTNGSANIGVTDTSKFPVDMPVSVPSTTGSLRAYQTFFVVSRSTSSGAGNITIANNMGDGAANATNPAIVWSGVSGTYPLITYGFPCIEIVGVNDMDTTVGLSIATGNLTASIGSKIITFTAGAGTPQVNQALTFSDGTATFPGGVWCTQVISSTSIRISEAATANRAGAAISITATSNISNIQPSSFYNVDVEGPAHNRVLIQNADVTFQIGTVFASQGGNSAGNGDASDICFRNAGGVYMGAGYAIDVDIDGSSVGKGLATMGVKMNSATAQTPINYNPIGLYNTGGVSGKSTMLNLSGQPWYNGMLTTLQNTQVGSGFEMTIPRVPFGKYTFNASGSITLDIYQAGALSYTGAGAVTWTLPTLQAGGPGLAQGNTAGLTYQITNCASAAVNLTLQCGGGNNFNHNAATTSYAIPRGGAMTVVAQWDSGSGAYWQVLSATSNITYP